MSIIVKCKAIREMFKNGDFRILAFEPFTPVNEELKLSEYFTFSCKGEYPYITIGKEYDLEIELISYDKKYGGAYKILSVLNLEKLDLHDLSREESFEIIMDCTSSEKLANNILDAYPNFIEIVLMNGKEAIDVKSIKGVGNAYLNAYTRELISKYKYYHIIQKFKDYKIDISDSKILCDNYKDEFGIEKAIKDSPYKVLKELGRSFENSDKMIMELRNELRESEQRCAYLILSVLERNEYDGNSKLSANFLYNYVLEEYPQAKELESFIVPVVKSNELFYYNETEQTIASISAYLGEKKIANFTKEKVKNPIKWDIDCTKYKEIKDGNLTDEQLNILETLCNNNFVIVNAKGGTGKSAAVLAIINMLKDNSLSYMILCPTGMVAKALKNLTNGDKTATLHKACLSNPEGLCPDVFIIEEGSMIGIELLCMLINCIANKDSKIIVNMDLGQIAPISYGCPMRDIVKSNIAPVCTLNQVFRYGEGGLYKMATDAYDMKFYINQFDYENNDRISIGENKDYTYVKYNGQIEQIIEEYKKFLDRGINPIDICVITCWNVTDFGTINLNNKIQEIVNPEIIEGKYIEKTIKNQKVMFKVNDNILNTKNCYDVLTHESYNMIKSDKILTKEDVETTEVMNGEVGKILSIENGNIIAQFDEEIIVFDKLMQNNLLLAYALTSYKLQGSQCPYVITLITPQFKKSLNKNIIYTDMSRTRKEVVEIIDANTLAEAIIIDAIEERQTNLENLLLEITD